MWSSSRSCGSGRGARSGSTTRSDGTGTSTLLRRTVDPRARTGARTASTGRVRSRSSLGWSRRCSRSASRTSWVHLGFLLDGTDCRGSPVRGGPVVFIPLDRRPRSTSEGHDAGRGHHRRGLRLGPGVRDGARLRADGLAVAAWTSRRGRRRPRAPARRRRRDAVEAAVARAEAELGPVAVVVTAAGYYERAPVGATGPTPGGACSPSSSAAP